MLIIQDATSSHRDVTILRHALMARTNKGAVGIVLAPGESMTYTFVISVSNTTIFD